MLAEGAGECDTTIHRFGCVIPYIFIVVFLAVAQPVTLVCALKQPSQCAVHKKT
jgi:hypothetical protein